MHTESTLRDLVIAISPCGVLEPSPQIAAQAWRGGGLGVLDLADGGWRSRQALAQAVRSGMPTGIRVPAGCTASPADVRGTASGLVNLVVLGVDSPWDIAETSAWTRVLAEVTSLEQAKAAAAAGAQGLIARGMESGGLVSDLSTFVLIQQLVADDSVTLPVWAAGGVGPRTALACVVGGAAGVVLDSQLGLMPESDLPGGVMKVLRRMDGSETVVSAGRRGVRVTGDPARLAGPRDQVEDTKLLPIGQDGHLAAHFAARWPDTAAAVRGLRAAIVDAVADDVAGHVLAPGGPLAASLGVRVPVAQGPMTRVSDQAGFAAAIAADGAMPFIALALADGQRSRKMLEEAAAAVGSKPWGVGVLGFVPEELRSAQLAVVLDIKPTWCIVAGGRPAQAKELEAAGIAAFLHVPSPGLLKQFLQSGVRRFVFEGAECGGHIGPRASFPLWESQLEVIEEFLAGASAETAGQLQVLFAGGIHDARSAAMVAAMAAPLTRQGAKIGVLMGTAYLFTREAVEHGAILPLFQKMALEAAETALLETSPGHVTRALRTPFVDEFGRQRAELEATGAGPKDIWLHLEMLNTGRLRLASKGLEHDGTLIDEPTQASEGLYMAGQVAVLRNSATTVAALHADVTSSAASFHDARKQELREVLAGATLDAGDGPEEPLDIAIIGMSGVFPGSLDTDGFWKTILSGQDQFREIPAERFDADMYYTPDVYGSKPGRTMMSKWGAFIDPVPFNPIKFGIPPSALGSIDPSQLLALEMASRALSDAGYAYDKPGVDHRRTGCVYAAEPGSDDGGALAMRAFLPAYLGGELPKELDEQLPTFTEDTFPGHLSNVVAGRIANRFNLGATNYTVDAACAASLAALDVACKQLSLGSADMMLCGAVDLHNSACDFLMFGSVYALSPTGRIAAFDAGADGTALGEGVACVVLKRLADAERDGDRIYAVIKGLGAASDGKARSLIAPRVDGQTRAMRRAYRQANISPAQVGLVEAHGTGTLLGDQTEMESLQGIFAEAGAQPGSCVLGSVKSQIGHTKSAAGMAGLIKAALGVYTGIQPPTSNLTKPNKAWEGETSPFTFVSQPRPWLAPPAERVAGLSAFGFGGTNFHVVISGHNGSPEPRHARNAWPAELFAFRGIDRAAAHRAIQSFAATLETASARPGGVRLQDLAAAAAQTADATAGQVQVAVVARDPAELAMLLERALAGEHDPAAGLIQPPASELAERGKTPTVAFMFPGQGSQRTGALGELFVAFPELRQYLEIGRDWAEKLFPSAAFGPDQEKQQADRLRDTRAAQPALGICGLAVSHLLGRLGVRPQMSGGHSYGELVALSTAGAFDPMTLLELSYARANAILSATGEDPGTMAAVSAAADQVSQALSQHGLADRVTLANLNAPGQVVISGPTPAVDGAVTALKAEGLKVRKIPVACAFHSPVVAAASGKFAEVLDAHPISAPEVTVWSNRTAAPHPADPVLIRAEMAAQISAPVRFSDQVEAMYAAGARVFVEAGPGQVLTNLVRDVLGDRPFLAVSCDGPHGQGIRKFLAAIAQLACAGVPVNLNWLFQGRESDPASLTANGRAVWTVNGHLIRDAKGAFLPGANSPARQIKEFSVSSPQSGAPEAQASAPAVQPSVPVAQASVPAVQTAVPVAQPSAPAVQPSAPAVQSVPAVQTAVPMVQTAVPVAYAPAPAVQDVALAEYLRASRELVSAQRDVMLAFLGQPASRYAWPQEAVAPAAEHTVLRQAPVLVTEVAPAALPAPAALAAAPPAVAAPPAPVTVAAPAAPAPAPAAPVTNGTATNGSAIPANGAPANGTAAHGPVANGSANGAANGSPANGAVASETVASVAPAAPAAAPSGAPAPTAEELQNTLLTLISERTGYPVDLIDLDLDLEADLSIDSIKRAEIAGEMASRLNMLSMDAAGNIDAAENVLEDLVRARTVRAIVDWLANAVAGGVPASSAPAPADAPALAAAPAAPEPAPVALAPEPAPVPAANGATATPANGAAAADTVVAQAAATEAGAGIGTGPVPTAEELQNTLLTLISERTGYPVDLIDLDLDLEADLSIDSIKRAEIAGEMASRLNMLSMDAAGNIDAADNMLEDLVRARTVRAITDWLVQALAGPAAKDGSAESEDLDAEAAALESAVAEDVLAVATPLRIVPRLAHLPDPAPSQTSVTGATFVVTGGTPVAERLAARLRELGAQVQASTLESVTTADIQGAGGLILLDGLATAGGPLPPAAFPAIKAALTSQPAAGQGWLLAAGDSGNADTSGLTGLFRAISLEYPGRFARYVALDRTEPADEIAERLLAELLAGGREPAVSYSGATRHQQDLVSEQLTAAPGAAPAAMTGQAAAQALGLTSDSVVVLIGGARGITALFARELAAASSCRIELVGRTQPPGEPLAPEVEAAPDALALRAALARQGMRKPAEIERAVRDILARREISATLTELSGFGSKARYHCADATDEEAIHQVLKLVREEHGRIDGLVYGAGIIEDKLIADKDPGSFTRVFNTKVTGAQVLLSAAEEFGLDTRFVVLYGSIAATFGSRGQSDYAAANDALESLSRSWAARTGRRCLTVHWGPWAPEGAHPGMVSPELSREYEKRGMGMVDPRAGALALLRELAWGDPALNAVIYTGMVADGSG